MSKPRKPLRVASLNLRAYPNHNNIGKLAKLLARHRPDIVLLQECKRPWLGVVCEEGCFDFSAHSHDVEPRLPYSAFPPDGTAIAVRSPLVLGEVWRIEPNAFKPAVVKARIPEVTPAGTAMPERLRDRYSGRTLLARISGHGKEFVACSFHATPGTGKVGGHEVGERKPFFHGGVAAALADLNEPFLFGIDANEPLAETADTVTFHWEEGRSGARKMEALLGLKGRRLHGARDLQREAALRDRLEPAGPDHLVRTYNTGNKIRGNRRFDSLWATKDFRLDRIEAHYKATLRAGGDHALLVADLNV